MATIELGTTSPIDENVENLPVHPLTGGSVSYGCGRTEGGAGWGGEEVTEVEVGGCTILSYLQVHGFSLCTLVAMSYRCKKVDGAVILRHLHRCL